MPTGKGSDFKIYHDEFYGGMFEEMAQNTSSFNGASNNTIRLVAKEHRGDFGRESFIKDIASLITRRDVASVAGVTDTGLTQDELVSVKVNRKIGPVAQTLDAWRKIGTDPKVMSYTLGKMVAKKKAGDYLNTALLAIANALMAQSGVLYDATADTTKTANHTALVSGLAKFGDASSEVSAWVMHSKPYFDLMKQAIADKIVEVAGVTIYEGTIATFNRPVIVTDAPGLLVAGSPNTYPILGLTASAITVEESEQEEIESQIVTGLENLVMRIQGEYAFNVGMKGLKWDSTKGANPTDAALGLGTNWIKAATSDKDLPGIVVKVQ